jgi:S-adenosylmethionine hydrolase
MRFIHLVADYGICDPAFNEVIHRLKSLDSSVEVCPTSIPSLSTIATGFWIAQYGLYNPSFDGVAIFSNTAPRKDNSSSRDKNEGEKFVFAKLDNGTIVLAVNSGFCLSFVKNNIKQLNKINVENKGSQFRSRDYYPKAVIGILNKESKYIGKKLDIPKIPDPPKNKIAFIDGFGNIKTTIRQSEVKKKTGNIVSIQLNRLKKKAIFSNGIFQIKEGSLVFAPGSSGGNDSFMEISLRGGSASSLFNNPKVEANIDWE